MYALAKQMFMEGKSMRSIANELNYDRKKLSQELKRDGTTIKSRGRTKGNQKYRHNTQAFKVIDSEEKAYWLGFLYADGSIYEPRGGVEITLAAKDVLHLKRLRDFLSPQSPIKPKDVVLNGVSYPAFRFYVTSMEIVHDLIAKGCPPAKSLILQFPTPDVVPDHLIHHFMRGYFDGDGTSHLRNDNQILIEILGTPEFLDGYYDKLSNFLFLTRPTEYGQAKGLRWSGNGNYSRFAEFIYKDATIYLQRKNLTAHVKPR